MNTALEQRICPKSAKISAATVPYLPPLPTLPLPAWSAASIYIGTNRQRSLCSVGECKSPCKIESCSADTKTNGDPCLCVVAGVFLAARQQQARWGGCQG